MRSMQIPMIFLRKLQKRTVYHGQNWQTVLHLKGKINDIGKRLRNTFHVCVHIIPESGENQQGRNFNDLSFLPDKRIYGQKRPKWRGNVFRVHFPTLRHKNAKLSRFAYIWLIISAKECGAVPMDPLWLTLGMIPRLSPYPVPRGYVIEIFLLIPGQSLPTCRRWLTGESLPSE